MNIFLYLKKNYFYFTNKSTFLPVLQFICSIFFTIIIYGLRPFIVVRLLYLPANRIGHFCGNPDVYICEKKAGLHDDHKRYFDTWYYSPPISNCQLKKMWGRSLYIWPYPIGNLIRSLIIRLPGGDKHVIPFNPYNIRDTNGVTSLSAPSLKFNQYEEIKGQTELMVMGIKKRDKIICFFSRDSQYLTNQFPSEDWTYHDYRNFPISDYQLAVEKLSDMGYYLVRMGSVVSEKLSFSNSMIIDYPMSGYRSDFLDIYLSAHCFFFISCGSGIDVVASLFRRPLVNVNFIPIELISSWEQDHIFILKKYWSNQDRRFMTIRELIKIGAGRFQQNQLFLDKGIQIINNTQEEILEVTLEMESRLTGNWISLPEDEELQDKFWSLIPKSELHGVIRSRIGTSFLKRNLYLLD